MKYVFVVNPIAGNDNKKKLFYRIKSAFRQIDDDMIIEETHKRGDAKIISAEYAKQYGADCVIVTCGGDGTVHEVVNGLAGTDTPMMVLPLGMGNDFAKKIYDTKNINVENVIKSFGLYNGKIKYDIKPIDIIDYNGEKGVNVLSFGLDTLVETMGRKIAAKAPFLGHHAYKVAVAPIIAKPIHYTISYKLNCVDKATGSEFTVEQSNKDYALMAICNASWYGGSFCPAPNSVLDDGLLDVCLVDGVSLAKALKLIPKYSSGTLNENTDSVCTNYYIKSGKVYMEDGSPLIGNCDGENFNYSELEFKVEPKAVKLCIIKD